jgi:hypothetical protein
MNAPTLQLVSAAFFACLAASPAAVTYLDPSPYFGVQDSPFFNEIISGHGVLEDFEDGQLNVPGATAPCGGTMSARPSVDEDDGIIDGDGFGTSFSSVGAPAGCPDFRVRFDFTPTFGGQLPTFIGMVIVDDISMREGGMTVFELEISLVDAEGAELDTNIIPFPEQFISRDANTHRFVGIRSDVGISHIEVSAHRIDHLQFGIPEPSSGVLVTMAGVLLLVRCRRR